MKSEFPPSLRPSVPPSSHTIRLRGPWGSQPLASCVRFTRVFHRPTGLGPQSKVWLVIDDVERPAIVALNDCVLGEVVPSRSNAPSLEPELRRCPARFDITDRLHPQNRLLIDVTCVAIDDEGRPLPHLGGDNQGGRLVGLVRLEIEQPQTW